MLQYNSDSIYSMLFTHVLWYLCSWWTCSICTLEHL